MGRHDWLTSVHGVQSRKEEWQLQQQLSGHHALKPGWRAAHQGILHLRHVELIEAQSLQQR